MTAKTKLESKLTQYGIKSVKIDIDVKNTHFAYSPGISNKYINEKIRKEHKKTMSFRMRKENNSVPIK
jgi:hypothetical protein